MSIAYAPWRRPEVPATMLGRPSNVNPGAPITNAPLGALMSEYRASESQFESPEETAQTSPAVFVVKVKDNPKISKDEWKTLESNYQNQLVTVTDSDVVETITDLQRNPDLANRKGVVIALVSGSWNDGVLCCIVPTKVVFNKTEFRGVLVSAAYDMASSTGYITLAVQHTQTVRVAENRTNAVAGMRYYYN